MIGVGVPIGQEVAGPKKRALFGHRSAHRARSGEGRFQPWNGLTPTPVRVVCFTVKSSLYINNRQHMVAYRMSVVEILGSLSIDLT